MKILMVSATDFELNPLKDEAVEVSYTPGCYQLSDHELFFLTTGVGMVATSFALGRSLAKSGYDLIINGGIAGSFSPRLKIGDVVEVRRDSFSELGAQDDEAFISIDDLGFGKSACFASFENNSIPLPKVSGITVNTVHGNEAAIKNTLKRFNPDIESMEGAAFFYACEHYQQPCLQIRAISNLVEKRNKENWNIPLAVNNLNNTLKAILCAL